MGFLTKFFFFVILVSYNLWLNERTMKISYNAKKSVFLFAGAVILLGFAPFAWTMAHTETIYVDKDGSGSADGSNDHPYHSIGDALDHAKDGDQVLVAKGSYKESIKIPKGVELRSQSSDRSDVTIEGSSRKPAVTMAHDSVLSSVTVKNGRQGVFAKEDANVHLSDVLVKSADRDGLYLGSADRDKRHRAYIDKVEVRDCGQAGIYSESRFVDIVNSDIHNNKTDGIDFAANVQAWLENDKIHDNKASGWKVVLDGSEIWTKNDDFRRNGREGVQVESNGGAGSFGLKKSKEVDNGRYGVALIARNAAALPMWKHIFLDTNSAWGNGIGQVSSVLFVK